MYVCVEADSADAVRAFVSDKFGSDTDLIAAGNHLAFITPPDKIKNITTALCDMGAKICNTLMIL